MSERLIQILIVEDHDLVRRGLQEVLKNYFGGCEFFEAANAVDARNIAEKSKTFDLIVLDLKLPGANGFDLLKRLHKLHENVPIVVISGDESSTLIYGALTHGARGYIPKSYSHEQFLEALDTVLSGEVYFSDKFKQPKEDYEQGRALVKELSARQLQIVSLLAQGKTNKEIATLLNLSASSVRSYLTIIFKQMNVSNRTEAVYIARILGLVGD